jgi:hypothetical protein
VLTDAPPKTWGWHLVDQSREHVGNGELAELAGYLSVDHHLEEQIAQLLGQMTGITGLQRVENFVGFFDEMGLQRGSGLLAIPRTAIGGAKTRHDFNEAVEDGSGGLGHVRS